MQDESINVKLGIACDKMLHGVAGGWVIGSSLLLMNAANGPEHHTVTHLGNAQCIVNDDVCSIAHLCDARGDASHWSASGQHDNECEEGNERSHGRLDM